MGPSRTYITATSGPAGKPSNYKAGGASRLACRYPARQPLPSGRCPAVPPPHSRNPASCCPSNDQQRTDATPPKGKTLVLTKAWCGTPEAVNRIAGFTRSKRLSTSTPAGPKFSAALGVAGVGGSL